MGPSFLRHNLQNRKQLCGQFGRVINKPKQTVFISTAREVKEVEKSTIQVYTANCEEEGKSAF